MKFMVSLIDDGSFMEEATPDEFQSMVDQMNEFIDEMTEAGVYGGGEGLGPPGAAKTLRYGENGKIVVTDGPFAETKEQVNGYMILDCEDIDEAIQWIKKMPGTGEGAIEIRAIFATADEVAEAYGRD
jgi:hypothetical protein